MKNEQTDLGILFVDDEEQTLKYFNRAFGKDFTVFTATNVKDGKAILEKQAGRIAILISDQRMPDERGVELLKFARNEYPNAIRILTTAYSDLDDAIEAVNGGEIHRYITKPWDLNTLKLELKQSMQFYLIRSERDELQREKLSAWQRLDGVNRLREIVAMASGFTITRNSVQAAQAFIEQIPTSHENNAASTFGSWSQLPEELQKISDACGQIIAALEECSESAFSSVSMDALLESAGSSLVIKEGSGGLSVEANESLLKWMLSILIEHWGKLPGSSGVSASVTDRDDRVEIHLSVENGSWGEMSLLDFPAGVLGAYFVCYHHFGELSIGSSDSDFAILITLPKNQAGQVDAPSDLSWIEQTLSRFENW
ncbi:MAG: two-component system probable response regulator PhcQ [Candidatus Pelagisphaera sp.]|jgi:two-component system probable response regulator PhcQ